MKKEVIQKSVTGLFIGLSIASFIYVNFLAESNPAQTASKNTLSATNVHSGNFNQPDSDEPKSSSPSLAVLSKIYVLIHKFVPSGK